MCRGPRPKGTPRWARGLAVFALSALLGTPARAASSEAEELLRKGEECFASYHKDDENVAEALSCFQKASRLEPQSAEVWVALARTYFHVGEQADERKEKLSFYGKAREAAETACKIAPDNADAHLWLGSSLGRYVETKNLAQAFASRGEIRREFERALELDPDHLVALNALGGMYEALPKLLGGSDKKALRLYTEAASIDANFTLTHLHLARFYTKKKEYVKAREECRLIMNYKKPVFGNDWEASHKPEAERLLKRLETKK